MQPLSKECGCSVTSFTADAQESRDAGPPEEKIDKFLQAVASCRIIGRQKRVANILHLRLLQLLLRLGACVALETRLRTDIAMSVLAVKLKRCRLVQFLR